MAGKEEPDELPDISEMVEVMRAVIATGDEMGAAVEVPHWPEWEKWCAAFQSQRALLARIDNILSTPDGEPVRTEP